MSYYSSDDPRSYSSGRIRPAAVLFWILIILAPFISAALLQLLTGTSALRLDAWNTTWNDEVGYFRVIRLLRHEFYPRGMYGFNEDAPANLAYGPYNIFTYVPYFVLSFFTGVENHNFIYYSNAALAVLAGLFYVLLVRPRAREGFFTVLFLVTYLVAGRYIWSGMSESSYNFFLILFTALVLWMIRHPSASASSQKAALFAMILIVFFWNTMRPYYFPLLVIPVYMIFRQKSALSGGAKALFFLLCALSAAGSLGLFFFFTNYNVARYFFDSTQTETLKQLLSSGSPVKMAEQILSANLDALREIKGYLSDSRWAGGIPLLYFAQSLFLLILLIRSLFAGDKKRDGRCAVIFFMLLGGAAIYEANVVLYSPVQLHRMMLSVTLAYGLLLIELGGGDNRLGFERIAGEIALLAVMAFFVVRAPENFRLPQIDGSTLSAADEQALEIEFRGILPLENDPWDNTIAKLPESENLQWEYMLPTYTSLNVCQTAVLEKLLTEGSVRSKFVLLSEKSDLNKLCEKQKYRIVWQGYGRIMYQTRD